MTLIPISSLYCTNKCTIRLDYLAFDIMTLEGTRELPLALGAEVEAAAAVGTGDSVELVVEVLVVA